MLEERSQPTGAYIFYTTNLFHTINLLNLLLPSGYPLHTPPNFLFVQLIFVSPFHDSQLQLQFATHIRDPHSRLAVL